MSGSRTNSAPEQSYEIASDFDSDVDLADLAALEGEDDSEEEGAGAGEEEDEDAPPRKKART